MLLLAVFFRKCAKIEVKKKKKERKQIEYSAWRTVSSIWAQILLKYRVLRLCLWISSALVVNDLSMCQSRQELVACNVNISFHLAMSCMRCASLRCKHHQGVGGRFQARSEQYIFYLTIVYFGQDNQILQSQFCNVLGLSDVEAFPKLSKKTDCSVYSKNLANQKY